MFSFVSLCNVLIGIGIGLIFPHLFKRLVYQLQVFITGIRISPAIPSNHLVSSLLVSDRLCYQRQVSKPKYDPAFTLTSPNSDYVVNNTMSPESHPIYSHAPLLINVRPMSGFLNIGWWDQEVNSSNMNHVSNAPLDLTSAGSNLVHKLVQFSQLRGHNVLDCGYGLGDSSFMLHLQYKCNVLGLTLSHQQASIANFRAQALDVNPTKFGLFQGDATRIESEWIHHGRPKIDAIVAIDCAYHFNSRFEFFQQAYNILNHFHMIKKKSKWNPRLVMVDLIISPSMIGYLFSRIINTPWTNLGTCQAYQNSLMEIGFTKVHIENISAHVFPGLTKYLLNQPIFSKWWNAGWIWWLACKWVGIDVVMVKALC